MDLPIVSIIIPLFNREKLVVETLDSLINQTYQNWEVVVVDDASTDNSFAVVEKIAKKDTRIKFLKRKIEHKGAPVCRNIGLENASGEFIVFMDSDDILFPYALEKRIKFLNDNPNIDYCVSKGIRGELPISNKNDYWLISTFNFKSAMTEFFAFSPPWLPLCPTYRTEFLKQNNLKWDENLEGHQDIDFHLKVLEKSANYKLVSNTPDAFWRVHNEGNIGSKFKNKEFEITQKYKILNNFKHLIYTNKQEILPILRILIASLLFSNSFKTYSQNSLKIYTSIQIFGGLKYKIFQLYSYLFNKKIRIITRIVRLTLIFLGQNEILKKNINTHFLKQKISSDEVVSLLKNSL
ncbi:MAG: glycosyltransferase family 2 protein [Bacteroidales bacterium]|nr:glycosyltransferase family 2 protein [Bacteroidales bacterium]